MGDSVLKSPMKGRELKNRKKPNMQKNHQHLLTNQLQAFSSVHALSSYTKQSAFFYPWFCSLVNPVSFYSSCVCVCVCKAPLIDLSQLL